MPNEPNIKFVGKATTTKDGKTVIPAEPPAVVNDGMTTIELPDAATQRAGFYHERAADIRRLFPDLYKEPFRFKKAQ